MGAAGLPGLASVSHDSHDSNVHDQSIASKKLPNINHLSPDQIQDMERQRRKASAQFQRDCIPAYKLQMLFEAPCTYLAIPKKLFRTSMKDLPADASADIELQLRTSHELAHDRIAKLSEWIRGNDQNGHMLTLDLDDECYNDEVTYRNEQAAKHAPTASGQG